MHLEFEFGKLIISCLPKRQQRNNSCQHIILSSPAHNQTAINMNRIKIIIIIGQRRNIENSMKPCNEALTKAAYKREMRHQENIRQNTTTTKKQKRNIILFSAPYSANVVTKVGNTSCPY